MSRSWPIRGCRSPRMACCALFNSKNKVRETRLDWSYSGIAIRNHWARGIGCSRPTFHGRRLQNWLYRAARALGVLKRESFVWTGDFQAFGEPMTPEVAEQQSAIETEVAYMRLGELQVACIPGELYPELVYGKFQEPVETGVD